MIDPALLDLLRCPENGTRLTPAPAETVEELNRLVANGELINLSGAKVSERIDAALIREENDLLYPIIDGIPVMLVDEAIAMDYLPISTE